MDAILQRLTELDEVSGVILVGKDGLIVSGTLHTEDEEMIGALSATAFGSLSTYTKQVNQGEIRHAIIETHDGTIQMAEVGDLILVVTTQQSRSLNLGRVRLEMKKVCRQILPLVTSQ